MRGSAAGDGIRTNRAAIQRHRLRRSGAEANEGENSPAGGACMHSSDSSPASHAPENSGASIPRSPLNRSDTISHHGNVTPEKLFRERVDYPLVTRRSIAFRGSSRALWWYEFYIRPAATAAGRGGSRVETRPHALGHLQDVPRHSLPGHPGAGSAGGQRGLPARPAAGDDRTAVAPPLTPRASDAAEPP